jgi:hypothetical protein
MYFILYKTNYFFIKHYDPLPICIFTLKIDNCVSFFCCVILDSYIKPCKSPRSSRKTKKILQANKTEVSVKLGLDYQKDDTTASVSYERIQSTNNKAHSNGIEGAVRWKF